jgi:drug/metabolite transporter (DMT)-like permease
MKKLHLIFLTAIISGFSIFINKFGVSMGNPYVFTFLKNSAVFVFLFSLILLFNEFKHFKKLKKQDWMKLITIGLVGGSIPFLLFFKGLSLTTSAKGAFIHKTMFVYVVVFAYFFLKEKFNWRIILASAALIFGNLLFLRVSWEPFNIGDLMILGATLFWAAENTLSKYTLKNVPSKIVAFSRMFFGSIFILMFLVATGNFADLLVLTKDQLLWSIVPSVLLGLYVLTWYTGLKDVPVTLASAILLLGSPITTLLNVLHAGVTLNLSQVTGIVFLVLGVVTFMYSVDSIKISRPNKILFKV